MNTHRLSRHFTVILFVAFVAAALFTLSVTPSVLVDKSNVTLSSPVPQFTGHDARDGLDGNEDTLFHSELGVVEGVLQLTLSQPIAVTRIQFIAQRDDAGVPLVQRLPAFVRILSPDIRRSRNGDSLHLANLDTVGGTATFELPPAEAPSSLCLLYAISPADCLTFAECAVYGHSTRIPGVTSRLFKALTCLLLMGIVAWWMTSRFRADSRLGAFTRAWLDQAFVTQQEIMRWLLITPLDRSFLLGTFLLSLSSIAVIYFYKCLHVTGLGVSPFLDGDGLWYMTCVKSMLHKLSWWRMPAFGAPLESDMRDFANPDYVHLLTTCALAKLSGSLAAGLWIYYLAGYGLAFTTSALCFRFFGVNRSLCFVLAFGYAFLPFHFRIGHYALSMYFTVPLGVCAAFALWSHYTLTSSHATKEVDRVQSRARAVLINGCVLLCDSAMAFGGAYYCIWYLLVLLYGAVYTFLSTSTIRVKTRACLSFFTHAALTIALFKCALYPFESITRDQGPNPESVSARSPIESDLYASSLTYLICPSVQSRLASSFGKTSFPPFVTALPTGENIDCYIGVPGSVGFLLACFAILKGMQNPMRVAFGSVPAMRFLSPLVLYIFLWMTYGGFNSIFAHVVTPQIRCWSRLTVLLSFVTTAIFGLCVSLAWDRLFSEGSREFRSLGTAAVVIVLGSLIAATQFPESVRPAAAMEWAATEKAYREFFSSVQVRNQTDGSRRILILPYMGHPEVVPPADIKHYEYYLPYLFMDNVAFSYGGCRGRPAGEVYRSLSSLQPHQMVSAAGKLGFTGILICRPLTYSELFMGIQAALDGQTPITSRGEKWAYFDLPSVETESGLSEEDILDIAAGLW